MWSSNARPKDMPNVTCHLSPGGDEEKQCLIRVLVVTCLCPAVYECTSIDYPGLLIRREVRAVDLGLVHTQSSKTKLDVG